MSENCNHNCEGCTADCADRSPESFIQAPHPSSRIKKVIGVVSGKGGVGKSLVTGLMSVLSSRRGNQTAILDADITGPSIPKMFGVKNRAQACEEGILPELTKTGIKLMSVGLLLENETDPVVWRGPIIANTVTQFWTDVLWETVDCMFVDMPPGTGDVPLTVFQSLPLDGIIIVTSPQELVSMIVAKAVKMAELMNIPILGIVENMSYAECPDCKKRIPLFGESHIAETAKSFGIDLVAQIPVDPKLAAAGDHGMIELFEGDWLDALADRVDAIQK